MLFLTGDPAELKAMYSKESKRPNRKVIPTKTGIQMRVEQCYLRYPPAMSRKHPVTYIDFLWKQEYRSRQTNNARQTIPSMIAHPFPYTSVLPDPMKKTSMVTKSIKSAKMIAIQ